ncbi:hypothetical protein N7478_010029 [Penicillium angulare]|uniref:uncharacterized protein n=1 Tax=Penicillium angulare TaxID=116970 RepID=UPI002540AE2E|nr:uncharacterized protein N7478_010029 [Penicillium angulare]KAJ5267221.1 hypothetical protein N7478_010029 [Penicillium angulare]
MTSEDHVQSILISALSLTSIMRLSLIVRFQQPWHFYHLDITLSAASSISFVLLSGLRWGEIYAVWCRTLLWMTSAFLTGQVFLRVHFQQCENPFIPAVLLRTYASYAVVSSLAKIASPIVGVFCPTASHPVCLFVLAVDYLMVTIWYLWLLGQATQARTRLRIISFCVSALFAILLAVAALGTLWKTWDIALELLTVLDTNDTDPYLDLVSPAH